MSISALNCPSLGMIIHSCQSDKITAWDLRSSYCRRYFQRFSNVFPLHSAITMLVPLCYVRGEEIQFVFPESRTKSCDGQLIEWWGISLRDNTTLLYLHLTCKQILPSTSLIDKWFCLWLVQLSQHIPFLKWFKKERP